MKGKCGGPRARTSTPISSPKATAATVFTSKASLLRPFVHPFNTYLLGTYYGLCPVLGLRDAAGNATDTGCRGRLIDSGGKETKHKDVSSLQVQTMCHLHGQQKQSQEKFQQHMSPRMTQVKGSRWGDGGAGEPLPGEGSALLTPAAAP